MASMDRIMSQLAKDRARRDNEMKYCSLCDQYFLNKDLLQMHIQHSGRHPRCTTCKKSFLNKNSLRNHFVLSNRHHYCSACEKHFQSPAGLKVHLEHSSVHSDDYDSDEDEFTADSRPDGWEDEMAANEERSAKAEGVAVDDRDTLSRVEVGMAVLNLKKRMGKESKVLKQTCAICLSNPKKMCVTKCGHLFCSSCIHHSFETGLGCPSCRTPGSVSQLRKVDLSFH